MRLHVSVQLAGTVVEDTVITVLHGLRLGEHPDAVVSFPGADLVVHLEPDGVRIRGHRLIDGQPLSLDLDPVQVELALVHGERMRSSTVLPVDGALPVLIAAIVLLMLTSQAAHQALQHKADVSAGVARAVEALLLPPDLRVLAEPEPVPVVISEPPSWTVPVRYVDHPEPQVEQAQDRHGAVTR